MGIIDNIIHVAIAIIYNLLAHNIVSYSYRDLQYDEKVKKSTMLLFVLGFAGWAVGKLIIEDNKNKKLQNNTVSSGFKIGGIILILTAVLVNWTNISEEIKILSIGALLLFLVQYSYKKNKKINKN